MLNGVFRYLVVQCPGLGSTTLGVQAQLTAAPRIHRPHNAEDKTCILKTERKREKGKKEKKDENKSQKKSVINNLKIR